jgi:archaemetzincin
MNTDKLCIGVLPVGKLPVITAQYVADHIHTLLHLPAKILPAIDNPSYAYDKKKLQYNAATIIKTLESMPYPDCPKVLALTNVDLFIPVFTHVFGEAREGGTHAVVSLYRLGRNLDGSHAAPHQNLERLVKVALHEIGHLFNGYHCTDDSCLMRFSVNVQELDDTPLCFCKYCTAFLSQSIKTSPWCDVPEIT